MYSNYTEYNFSFYALMTKEIFINLSHLKIKRLPSTVFSNTSKLDLRRNLFTDMNLIPLPNLSTLDMSDNKIKYIQCKNIPNVLSLDLSYNLITNINNLPSGLEELYLICNDITKIENLHLPHLRILDLAVNEIKTIENLDNCPFLHELYLGSNQISELPDLTHLKHLKTLDLQNNNLVKIDCKSLPVSLNQLLLSENSQLTEIININCLTNLNLLAIKKTLITDINVNKHVEVWR